MTDPAYPSAPPGTLSLHDFEPLLLAELIVLRAAASGDIAKVSYRRPRSPTPDVRLRGEFLAFLARGGGEGAQVAGRRLQIMGACITGRIDLAGAVLPLSLWLYRCTVGPVPIFEGARVLGSLTFSDSSLPGLRADLCLVEGDLSLGAGCDVAGVVQLNGAFVSRNLDCERLQLEGTNSTGQTMPQRLVADRIEVGGDVIFENDVGVAGEVRFVGARIGGSFRATGARVTADVDESGARHVALNLDRIHIGADLLLNGGFSAAGAVRLEQAHIGGDLDATQAEFDVVGDASWGANGSALRLDRARIGGALILRELRGPLQGASLVDTQVGTLSDDAGTWGQHHALDGFAYTRFGPEAPTDAAMRLSWLARQQAAHLDLDYRPDPWRRLQQALRRGGHTESAAEVAIGRERHLRRIGRVGAGASPATRWIARAAHSVWGFIAGYGHRPLRLLATAILVWLACGSAYWVAAERGAFVLASTAPTADPTLAACPENCPQLPPGVPRFHAFVYSLDTLLPLANLRQQRQWIAARDRFLTRIEPVSTVPGLQWLAWFEGAAGWALSLTWLAGLLRIGDRDRGVR